VHYAPAHWLKQFHEDYANATDLATMMKDESAENWKQLWRIKANPNTQAGLGAPFLGPWVLCEINDLNLRLCRNAYYSGIDPEGNQLPYIDSVYSRKMESPAVAQLRAMAGETDLLSGRVVSIPELPLYIKNMEKGDYSILHWPAFAPDASIIFNQTWNEDPEIGRWLRTTNFRIALSLAIDRDAINQTQYLGLGLSSNNMVPEGTVYHPGAEYTHLNATFDVAKANELLDALGLKDTDGDGVRNRVGDLDGNTGNLELYSPVGINFIPHALLIQDNWAKVGIKLEIKQDPEYHRKIVNNEEYIVIASGHHGGADPMNPWYGEMKYGPGYINSYHGPLQAWCYVSAGKDPRGHCPGDVDPSFQPLAPAGNYPSDPTGLVERGLDIWDAGATTAQGSAERIAMGKEIMIIQAEQQFEISIVNGAGQNRGILIKRNNFRNVPVTNWPTRAVGFWPAVYYFEGGIDNMNNPGNKSLLYKSVNHVIPASSR